MKAMISTAPSRSIAPPTLASCLAALAFLLPPAHGLAQVVARDAAPSSLDETLRRDVPSGIPMNGFGQSLAPSRPAAVEGFWRVRDVDRQGIALRTQVDAMTASFTRQPGEQVVKPSGFRKRSADLFRAQRDVKIGHQEMQVRLRLRAKSRNAISVELRF